jgi:hypothetical protein
VPSCSKECLEDYIMDARGLEEALRALVLEDVAPLSCVKAMAMVGIVAHADANGSAKKCQSHDSSQSWFDAQALSTPVIACLY